MCDVEDDFFFTENALSLQDLTTSFNGDFSNNNPTSTSQDTVVSVSD